MEEKCNLFASKGKKNPSWAFSCIVRFRLSGSSHDFSPKPSPAPSFPGLASKPVYDGAGYEIGCIVLDKVTGLRDGEQGPVLFHPFRGVVQATGQQKWVLQAVNLEDRGLHFDDWRRGVLIGWMWVVL